jgi:hypothetical protein
MRLRHLLRGRAIWRLRTTRSSVSEQRNGKRINAIGTLSPPLTYEKTLAKRMWLMFQVKDVLFLRDRLLYFVRKLKRRNACQNEN